MPDDTTLPRAFQRAPVATDAHFFKLRVPLLDQGRMDTEVTRAAGLAASGVPSTGGGGSRYPGQSRSISERVRPSHSPAWRSRRSGSITTGPTPSSTAMIAAVSAARCRSDDTMASTTPNDRDAWNAW